MENKALFPNSAAGADDQFLEQLADITAKVLRFTSAGGSAIALVSGSVAITRASSGNLAPDVDSELRLDGSFAGLCIQKGELLYCEDAENDTRVDPSASAALGIRSMVMVPVGEKGNVRGVLASFSGMSNGFRPTHIAVMRTLADIVNELVMRQDKSPHAPVLEMPVRSPERPAVPPAPAEPTVAPAVDRIVAPLPPDVEKSIAAATNKVPPIADPYEPPANLVERAMKTLAAEPEPQPPSRIPVPTASASAPSPSKPEDSKPLIKDRFERPEPVGSSSGKFKVPAEPVGSTSGKFSVPVFEEPVRKQDELTSMVALVNAQKRAEASAPEAKNDILPAAADPRLEAPAAKTVSAAAAAPKMAPVSKPLAKTEKAPVVGSSHEFESPMFRGLEQEPRESSINFKMIAAVIVAVVVIALAGWGFRSFMQSRQAATVAAPAANDTTQHASQTAENPTAQSVPSGSQPVTAGAQSPQAANTSTKRSGEATAAVQSEPRQEPTTASRQQPLLVANTGAVPRRSAEQVEAPSLALNAKPEMGDLLAAKKTVTPTLTVKRSVLSPPEVIRRVPPKFPDFARRANPAGDRVVLNVTVGADGKVKNVQVVRGQAVFAESATSAVKQWQYRPAFLNGEPVEATVEVVVSFTGGR